MSDLNINLINNNFREQKVKEILCGLLSKYDLNKYLITKNINIQFKVEPHSHPILTLNTVSFDEDYILSQFLHEQIHWYLSNIKKETMSLISKLKKEYPDAPCKLPEGSRTEESTYLHLIVNLLEYKALIGIIGKRKAKTILLSKPYYTWIYNTVIKDYNKLTKTITV